MIPVDETGFRKRAIAKAKEMGAHVSHIEAHESAAGIPDLSIFPPSRPWVSPRPEIWLELKVIKHGTVVLRPTQKRWHRERHEAGGRSWVAVLDRDNGNILLVPGHIAAGLDNQYKSWKAVSRTSNIDGNWFEIIWSDNERQQSKPDRNATPQNPRGTEATFPKGGQNVGSNHWLTNKP